jgi:hypothetical protein
LSIGDVADEDLKAGAWRQRVGPAHDGVDRVARLEGLPDHLHARFAVRTENGDDHRFSSCLSTPRPDRPCSAVAGRESRPRLN